MKLLKKNQLAILVISLMLITAGYLSYGSNYNNQAMGATSKPEEEQNVDLASLGDAELVNTNVTEKNNSTESVTQTPEQRKEDSPTELTNSNISNDEYFTKSKLERNVMYSQMTARYQEIMSSNTGAPEQKTVAQQEINKINGIQNAIMIAENLLISKGFNQNIIFVNGDSISIIIGKENLEQDEVAQIQNIVSRELKANVENIHISKK